jgi:WD40 repeat protein
MAVLLLQVLLSAGWDATVQVWDLRVGHAVRSMAGGSWVCGDGLDVQGSRVLTGSWRDKQPLQVRAGRKLTRSFDWQG